MSRTPNIKTAIPKRRYVIGEFSAVLLGEIESGDPNRYEHIFAAVRSGDSQPLLYIISERASRAERDQGSHRLRVVTETGEQVLGVSDRWRDGDAFVEQAIAVMRSSLMLTDEPVARVM